MMNRRTALVALGEAVAAVTLAGCSVKKEIKVKNTNKIFMIAVIVNPPAKLLSGSVIPAAAFTKNGGKFLHPGEVAIFPVNGKNFEIYAALDSLGDIITSTSATLSDNAISFAGDSGYLVDFNVKAKKATIEVGPPHFDF